MAVSSPSIGDNWRPCRYLSPGAVKNLARRHQEPRQATSRRAECSVAV
ncbi:hypothetical protein A2U01_0078690 [Trifolium medium]|uniref:Uncharacterized protein n=1 Tax=Trifolium medium TaxID=97028 RepID=A0A392T8S5_9FABA|nr:hypothetical protein [Trifolium medium]